MFKIYEWKFFSNFGKYFDYYNKNKKAHLDDIIVIVNSMYDILDYPASSLLASLVLEKYYLTCQINLD